MHFDRCVAAFYEGQYLQITLNVEVDVHRCDLVAISHHLPKMLQEFWAGWGRAGPPPPMAAVASDVLSRKLKRSHSGSAGMPVAARRVSNSAFPTFAPSGSSNYRPSGTHQRYYRVIQAQLCHVWAHTHTHRELCAWRGKL